MTSLSPPYFNSLHGSQKDQKNENEPKDPSLSQAHSKRPGSLCSSPPIEHLTYTPPISENESESSSSDEESTDFLTQDENTSALHDTGKPYCLPPPSNIQGVLPEDLDTPDSHVPRDPRLIRLTGVHPFNVEPPLSDLYNEGFLTSVNLHFVRNHGLVPVCEDNDMLDWEFTVEGMVKNPIKMTLRDLITDYNQITYPMTMVCAGNRRKEQNMVRKSKGFSWGAAGLSTALWTGVPIGELLARAQPKRGARYVCFEGADELPNGYYGTSVKLNWCLDPNKGIIVAHKMNGETLQPDHGKPVRIIVPGSIGGRSVKWLRKIIVTSEPSDNWYHIYDNRVLPTEVTPETSDHLPEVWRDERYAIYGLNVNSVICFPAHGETLSLRPKPANYRVRGYAYAGAGRRVTRTEVTLDRGKTWELARMRYPEDDYRSAPDDDTLYGGQLDVWWRETSFCWSFWEIDIPITRLLQADDIMIRAMDEGLASQPRDMYWNVTGMMNNPWFRVVIHRNEDSLTFEHPTQPALMPGGWMERVKKAGGDLANGFWGEQLTIPDKQPEAPITKEKVIQITNPDVNRVVSLEELKRHSSKTEPWFVVDGEVYDGTPFLDEHPGGATSIYGVAGQDSSEAFTTIHSENAKAMLPSYHIGTLDDISKAALAKEEAIARTSPVRPVFLQSRAWSSAILKEKTAVSPDSFIFTFHLDHENQELGVAVGQHFMMQLNDPSTKESIVRAYTPISEVDEKGRLRVLIKVYYATPEQPCGRMTEALDSLPLGSSVNFQGPAGRFTYDGRGTCIVGEHRYNVRRFVMICGGSGITPIFQVLRAIMKDRDDLTECLVLYGNRTEDDILCRSELDHMAKNNKDRCRLVYSLTQPGGSWGGLTGRFDKSVISHEVGPPQSSEVGRDMALICGPEGMEKAAEAALLDMQWTRGSIVVL